ncbi:MAG TPA: LysE family translocator [Acidobacteriota bacterium]|nr:LysE family translocator [Acidobacteriota bacterium]
MSELGPYLEFAAISFLMALSPGPSWAYTISATLGHGRRSGMIGNLGNSTGILFHALAATAGLSALLNYSVTAFSVLKLAGAAYLVYLGISAFLGKSLFEARAYRPKRTGWQIYRNGALVNILNPKMSLLFVALLPQFVVPAQPHPEFQIAIMGMMHSVIAFFVHTHVVLAAGIITARLASSGRAQRVVRWALGSLFIGFGLRLGLTE